MGDKWSGWTQEYVQLTAGRFEGRFSAIDFGRVQMRRERHEKSVQQFGQAPGSARHFAVQLADSGADAAFFCGLPVGRFHILALPAASEFSFRTPERSDYIAVSVHESLLAEWQTQRAPELMTHATKNNALALTPDSYGTLAAALQAVLAMSRGNLPLLADAAVRGRVERLLLHAFSEAASPEAADASSLHARNRSTLLRRSKDYIDEHASEAIAISDLCLRLGVSRRTVQSIFVEAYGQSAGQYLLTLRLNRARSDLRNATRGLTVGDIAARWGFWHPSYFTAAYKRLFGELPSHTLAAGSRAAVSLPTR